MDGLITILFFSILTVFTIFLSKAEVIMLKLKNKKYKNAELEIEILKELILEQSEGIHF